MRSDHKKEIEGLVDYYSLLNRRRQVQTVVTVDIKVELWDVRRVEICGQYDMVDPGCRIWTVQAQWITFDSSAHFEDILGQDSFLLTRAMSPHKQMAFS